MIRAFTILVILFPLAAVAWHYGPGQHQLAFESADVLIRQAEAAAREEKWEEAVALFTQSLDNIPEELAETGKRKRQQILFAQAKARIQTGEILAGEEQLETLLEEVQSEDALDLELAEAVRHELGVTGYHVAWLMRLEGATAEEWKPEAERARQHFRLLAEETEPAGDEATAFHKNLEAVIRLEQMDLSELRAMPLPKRCPNPNCCRNLSQRKRQQRQSRCESPGDKKDKKNQEPKDARKEINKEGAGLQKRYGTGS